MCLLAVATLARAADNKSLAKEAFQEGTRQYDLGDYAKALELFKKAYLNYEEPVILFNVAQCERQLGDKPEAVKLYKSYLRKLPNTPNHDEVERIIQRLEAEIAEEQATKKEPPQALEPVDMAAVPPSPLPLAATDRDPQLHAAAPAPAAPAKPPIYRRGWFWGVVATAVVVVGTSIALGVALAPRYPAAAATVDGN